MGNVLYTLEYDDYQYDENVPCSDSVFCKTTEQDSVFYRTTEQVEEDVIGVHLITPLESPLTSWYVLITSSHIYRVALILKILFLKHS